MLSSRTPSKDGPMYLKFFFIIFLVGKVDAFIQVKFAGIELSTEVVKKSFGTFTIFWSYFCRTHLE